MLSRALPKDILAEPRQRLDTLAERLPRALRANAHVHHTQYTRVASRLAPQLLINTFERRKERYANLNQRLKSGLLANAQAHQARLLRYRERVTAFGERSRRATLALLKQHHTRIERAERLLAAFSYREVLKRGFALVRDEQGQPVRAAAQVASGSRLDIEFADGRIAAVADGAAAIVVRETVVTETTIVDVVPKPRPKKPRGDGESGGGQGSLFG
jgi:exodeoxyribonuclease VII large subunit